MNDFRYKPIYLDYPILQISYVLLWFPLGLMFSIFTSTVIVFISSKIIIFILELLFPVEMEYYLLSGRISYIIEPFYDVTMIVYDIVFLILGLELISKYIDIKRKMYE